MRRVRDSEAPGISIATPVAVASDLGMARCQIDLPPVKNCQKVLIVESWVHLTDLEQAAI